MPTQAGKVLKRIPLIEMAIDRNNWGTKARNRLAGALGEYAKLRIAKLVGIQDYWSDEVKRLVKPVAVLMDKTRIKTTSGFDRRKAMAEAIREASGEQVQVKDAKNELKTDFPKLLDKILRTQFTSDELLADMIKEYLPELADLIGK